jgi:hypothetical protein
MIVVSDLLDMFVRDPQIEANESKNLINQIVNSITRSKALEDVLVVVSLPSLDRAYHHSIDKRSISSSSYNKIILPRFNKCIEIMDSHENRNNMIDVKVRTNNCIRNRNTTNDFHNGKLLSINKRDLLTVSAPTK